MSLLLDTLKALVAVGATPEQMLVVVEAMEPAAGRGRQKPNDERVWVYVMAEDYPDSDLVKVGISQHPNYRRLVLEKEEARNLYVAHTEGPFLRATAYDIEQRSHGCLEEFHSRGEWFVCGVDRAIEAIRDSLGALA